MGDLLSLDDSPSTLLRLFLELIASERDSKHKRLLIIGNKLRVAGGEWGGGWSNWVMDIKEGTGCNEPWVLHKTRESVNSLPLKLVIH